MNAPPRPGGCGGVLLSGRSAAGCAEARTGAAFTSTTQCWSMQHEINFEEPGAFSSFQILVRVLTLPSIDVVCA